MQDQKKKGVIAASAGNHALALSYHGKDLGIPVTVVMPLNAPIMKISACRRHGATVHVNGADLIEVHSHSYLNDTDVANEFSEGIKSRRQKQRA